MNRVREWLIRALGGTLRRETVAAPTLGLQEAKQRLGSCIAGLRLIDGLLSGGQVADAHKQVRVLYCSLSGNVAPPSIKGTP